LTEAHSPDDAVAQLQRVFWLLIAAAFIVSVTSQVMNPVLPAIASDFDVTVAQVGLALTAYLLPYGLFQLMYGPVADRVGRVRVVSVALAVAAAASLLCGLSPNLPSLVVFRFLTGAAAAAVFPQTLAYFGDTIPYAKRQAAIGYSAMSISLGVVSAGALGGLLAAVVSWRAIFVIMALVSAAITLLILREPAVRERPAHAGSSVLAAYRIALADRRHLLFYALVVLEGTIILGAFSYFGLILNDRDGFSYTQLGLILALLGITSIVTGRHLGWFVRRLGEQRMLIAGGSAITLAFVLAAMPAPIPSFLFAMVAAGFGFTAVHTTVQTRATELAPQARATGIAVFAFSHFLGGSLGSIIWAQGFERIGYNATLLTISAAAATFTTLAAAFLAALSQPHHAPDVA
jgi:predicted MFS family arabinose efflux permease